MLPKAVNDATTTVSAYDTVDISVLSNDLGTGLGTITLTAKPAQGTTTVVGNVIRYQAPTAATSGTIKYTVTDSFGLVSAEATAPVRSPTLSLRTSATPRSHFPTVRSPRRRTSTS